MAVNFLTSGANFVANRWATSGYLTRTVAVVYIAPIAVWGTCTIEAVFRSALRLLHTCVAFNKESRSYRWGETINNAKSAYATFLITLVSPVPIIGTFKSYAAMAKMVSNHVSNTWKLRELQQKANTHAAETLFHELNAWEPNIDDLIAKALEPAALTPELIKATAGKLRASLVGRSWIFTGLFNIVDGACRAVVIIAKRIHRLIAAIFSGRIIRFIVRSFEVIKNAAFQQVQAVCDNVDQPHRLDVPDKPLPDIYRDVLTSVLAKCETDQWKESAVIWAAVANRNFRMHATSNALARLSTDGPLPEGAPHDYFYKLRELAAACSRYSKVKAGTPVRKIDKKGIEQKIINPAEEKAEILTYFKPILPYIETFDRKCTANMTDQAKQDLIWTLLDQMPNLREITLDMKEVDPRWQMLMAARLAKHSPQLDQVTFLNTDQRAVTIMRRFCRLICTVTMQ